MNGTESPALNIEGRLLERQGLWVFGFRVEDVAQIDHAMKRVRMRGPQLTLSLQPFVQHLLRLRKAALHEHVSGQYRARTQRLRMPRTKTRWRISARVPLEIRLAEKAGIRIRHRVHHLSL
jgi:hypothetical protein